MRLDGDSRTAGALLAARLARTPQQRDQARAAALRLIVGDGDGDATRALQVLHDDLARDIPYLAKQGWAMRSLAAIAWASAADADPQTGDLLARDPDPRVRRAFANAIARTSSAPHINSVRGSLMADPRYSVRRLIPENSAATLLLMVTASAKRHQAFPQVLVALQDHRRPTVARARGER